MLNQVREEHSQLVWERGSVCVSPGSSTTAVGPRTADQSNSKQAELRTWMFLWLGVFPLVRTEELCVPETMLLMHDDSSILYI